MGSSRHFLAAYRGVPAGTESTISPGEGAGEGSDHAVSEIADGFRIERPRRVPVTVRLDGRAFVIASGDGPDTRCGLCEDLTARVGRHLLQGRFLPQNECYFERRAINGSMLRHESRAIARVIRAQRGRLLAKVDPTVVAVQRAVFLATHDHTDLAEHEALYRELYIVRDVLNYRAAAIVLYRVGADLWPEGIAVAPEAYEANMYPPPEERIYALRNWRGLFSPSGVPYRSLNWTLMNLPSTIPVYLTSYLRSVKLERPIVSPLVLKAVLYRVANACASIGRASSAVTANQIRILQHTTEDELRGAVARVAAYTGSPFDSKGALRRLVEFMAAYPEPHHGRLGGLLKKAIRCDKCRYCDPQILQEVLDEVGGAATPTARPPIPLPAVPGITFLSTVGEIIEEGLTMRHCIAEEASSAVDGHSYIFHIEHHGEHASIEVDSNGEVTQASGPRNCQNGATRWGAARLRIWGRDLARSVRPLHRRGMLFDFPPG